MHGDVSKTDVSSAGSSIGIFADFEDAFNELMTYKLSYFEAYPKETPKSLLVSLKKRISDILDKLFLHDAGVVDEADLLLMEGRLRNLHPDFDEKVCGCRAIVNWS